MGIDTALRLSSRAVALSGLFSLLLTGEAAYWILGPAFAVAISGVISEPLARPALSPRTVTALTVPFAAFAIMDFFYISGSLILAGADFLVLLLCLRLLSLERHKDYIQLYTVSFFILLASTGLSTDIYFLAAFLVFFISLTWALILLTIKGEAGGEEGRAGRLKIGRFFFAGTAGLTFLATFFTVIIFLIIPRVGVGYFSRKAGGLMKSGFSDKVELSSGGEVLLDPTAVMRIEFPGMDEQPEGPLYLRGKVFDVYDGRKWEDSARGMRPIPRSPDGVYRTAVGRGMRGAVRQDITLEPLDSPVLFSVYPPVEVSGDVRAVSEDGYGTLYLPGTPGARVRYSVLSGSGLRQGPRGESGEELQRYLQLPEGSERVRQLAGEVSGNENRPAVKARKLEKYLEENYSYTLSPPLASGGDHVENFLFTTKSGYCVHFATAMALLLRTEGIPARLVSGFMGGEWNGYGKYLLVRQEDAHTWVEAWLPGSGWVRIDPTPESGRAGRNLFGGALGAVDFFKYKWDRWVVYYNLRDQAGAARKVFSAFQSARRKIADADKRLRFDFRVSVSKDLKKKVAFLPVLISMAILAVFFGRRYLRKARKIKARPKVDFYDEAVRMLRERGISRRPGETPLEFAGGLLDRHGEVFVSFGYLTETYNKVRFGACPVNPAEEKQIKEALRNLKASLKDTTSGRRG